MTSPPSDGHKGVVVQWKGAGTVQRIRKVGSLRPGGIPKKEHLTGHVRVPAAEEEDVPRGHGDGGGVYPWLVEIGVLCPSRGKRRQRNATHRQSHIVVLAFPTADNHLRIGKNESIVSPSLLWKFRH